MSKSAIYTVNNTIQSVDVDGTLILGSIARRFGCGVNLNGNGINVEDAGYYKVEASVTASPEAIGSVTVGLYNNGVLVQGGTASQYAETASQPVNVSINTIVRVFCQSTANLTLVLSGTASDVSNVALTVVKL